MKRRSSLAMTQMTRSLRANTPEGNAIKLALLHDAAAVEKQFGGAAHAHARAANLEQGVGPPLCGGAIEGREESSRAIGRTAA